MVSSLFSSLTGKVKPYLYCLGFPVRNRALFPSTDTPAVKSTFSASVKVNFRLYFFSAREKLDCNLCVIGQILSYMCTFMMDQGICGSCHH